MDDLDLAVGLWTRGGGEGWENTLNTVTASRSRSWSQSERQRLTFINEYNFNDSIQWDIDFVGAHAIGTAIGWTIVAVTELLRIDVIVLGQ